MTEYAIADVGSNTIVLITYEIRDSRPVQNIYRSTPVHLIDYVRDGVMSKEGIQKAAEVLRSYYAEAKARNIKYCWADITEPCRIENANELVSALQETGFEVFPLSGYEEAYYDYRGACLSWPELNDGIAFDVGGGSTELISFRNGECVDAVSFHLGCVRLAHLPLDTEACETEIRKMQAMYPSLDTKVKTLVGIGGTVRAAALAASAIYGTKNIVKTEQFKELFEKIRNKDPRFTEVFLKTVDPGRQPVFLSGLHMILEIARIMEAEEILISATGIREGFLLETIRKQQAD